MTEVEKRRIQVNRSALLFIVERVLEPPDLELMKMLIPSLFRRLETKEKQGA